MQMFGERALLAVTAVVQRKARRIEHVKERDWVGGYCNSPSMIG